MYDMLVALFSKYSLFDDGEERMAVSIALMMIIRRNRLNRRLCNEMQQRLLQRIKPKLQDRI